MPSLQSYQTNPWDEDALHPAYSASFLNMRPAPEFATGEVVLASLHRKIGWGKPESQVPTRGRHLLKQLDGGGHRLPDNRRVSAAVWKELLEGILRSPKQPNQSKKRFLQISPIVPDAAIYSLSARLAANSWNPGQMVARYLQFGDASAEGTQDRWKRLYEALSINENDDVWSKFLSREFSAWRASEDNWKLRELEEFSPATLWNRHPLPTPASALAEDIDAALRLKPLLTRRQWISILEAIIRIGCASQTMWVCRANNDIFEMLSLTIRDGQALPVQAIASRLSMSRGLWKQGQRASGALKEFPRQFLIGRLGINLCLWHCEKAATETGQPLETFALSNAEEISKFFAQVRSLRHLLNWKEISSQLQAAIELDPRKIAIKQGIGSNIEEFLRHVLGQRQTAERGLEAYDQGYLLKKAGSYASAPWIVSLGPVLLLAMVHACTADSRGPRTVENLCQFLARYGVTLSPEHVAESDVGRILRNLGLVLDSPDAEGGMVLLNPFHTATRAEST